MFWQFVSFQLYHKCMHTALARNFLDTKHFHSLTAILLDVHYPTFSYLYMYMTRKSPQPKLSTPAGENLQNISAFYESI